jgi:hypothetical protein
MLKLSDFLKFILSNPYIKDFQLEGLSRNDLIKFVKKKVATQNETQKQLETTKKEAQV